MTAWSGSMCQVGRVLAVALPLCIGPTCPAAVPPAGDERPRQPRQTSVASGTDLLISDQSLAAAGMLRQVIASALQEPYEKKDNWGKMRRISVGLEPRGNGLKWRLYAKTKEVPHGVWKHFRIRIINPDENLRVQVEQLHVLPSKRVAATVHVSAPLAGWARFRIYEHGIHLGTYTVEGQSTVYLRLDCEVGLRLEKGSPLPTFIIEPAIKSVEVKLLDFELRRISEAHGLVVRELGRGLKSVIEDELKPHKLTARLNRALARKQDDMRLNPNDLLVGGLDAASFLEPVDREDDGMEP